MSRDYADHCNREWDRLEAEPEDDMSGTSPAENLERAREMREDFELQCAIKNCALLNEQGC